jgi:hypothetical protein
MSQPENHFDAIQTEDDTSTAVAARNKVEKRIRNRISRENREVEAEVRSLVSDVEDALAGESAVWPEQLLRKLHWYLWHDPRRADILSPASDALDPRTKIQFQNMHHDREQGIRPDPYREYEVLTEVGKAQGHYSGISDTTRYSPIQFSRIDPGAGKGSASGDIPPVGRIRIGASEAIDFEERLPEIDHTSCEHIIAVALPRKGKDSTIVTMAGNLKDYHNYKIISIHDDGRRETDMWACPSDDEGIQDNLERMGQSPKAYETAVFVPAMSGLPDELPANFIPFTIGIDDLTADLILQLSGINTGDRNTIDRIQRALEDAQDSTNDQVETLVARLEEYSEELEAEVTIVEQRADSDDMTDADLGGDREVAARDDEGNVRQINFPMPSDDVLKECAQRILTLAAEGLIEDSEADTNLDIVEEIKRNDRVAVLNCDYLEERNKPLKYTITDLWLNLILRARREHPSIPRVGLEIRELKNIAPSSMSNAEYPDVIRPLSQTIYEIASQGGSTRVLMLGSTQKLNDVFKAVRTNMPIKIMLGLDRGLIETMDKRLSMPYELKDHLEGCGPGEGALKIGENFYWPCFFRGARCALGDGDRSWRDRYALAWGYRVREHEDDGWMRTHGDRVAWVDHRGNAHAANSPPELHEWYLLPEDFTAVLDGGSIGDCSTADEFDALVDRESCEAAAGERRDHDNPNDLSLRRTSIAGKERSIILRGVEEAKQERIADVLRQTNEDADVSESEVTGDDRLRLPAAIEAWVDYQEKKRQRHLEVLSEIERNEITTREVLSDYTGVPDGTLGPYLSDRKELGACIVKRDGVYELSEIGKTALQLPWDELTE